MNEPVMTFEDRLKRLEMIVKKMESGELALDASLKLFQEGNELLRGLQTELAKAEAEVVRVIEQAKKPE